MGSSQVDWENPEVEEEWVSQQRQVLEAYLHLQGLKHGAIGEWPAWHVAPYAAVWAIESLAKPGWIGWWGISGDLPTDYISSLVLQPPQHPRKALRAFGQNWRAFVQAGRAGWNQDDVTIGNSYSFDEAAPMLEARAALLLKWAEDDSLWDED